MPSIISTECLKARIYCVEDICKETKLCLVHCEMKNHGHCIEYHCVRASDIVCKDFCVIHCRNMSHGHCTDDCESTENFCKEINLERLNASNTLLCKKCCTNEWHDLHCWRDQCDSTDFCDISGNTCISCCSDAGHDTHCGDYGCIKLENICSTTDRCKKHCYIDECKLHNDDVSDSE